MKKILFLTMAAVVVSFSANAQQGDWVIGGKLTGLDLTHSFKEGYSQTTFDLAATVGYFATDKFMLDVTLGIGAGEGYSSFNFGVGARYFFYDNFFARVGYEGVKTKGTDFGSVIGVSVGYDYFISDKVFFEPAIFFKKNLAKGTANQIGLSMGLGVKF